MIDLGLADVRPLPGIAAERWAELSRRMHSRIFLRSEGVACEVGAPQVVSGKLLEQSIDVVARINRFYAGVAAAYYERPDLRAEFLVNPLIEPLLELEAEQSVATPLSRLDAVLEPDGTVRVIEINSVGVCLFHMRNLLYLIRELARGGFEAEARELDELVRCVVVDGFLRYAKARGSLRARPVVGALSPSGWLRGGHRLFRAAFQRAGCDYVFGGPEHLEVSDAGVTMRGTRVDILWADFFLYIAYQCNRYQETKFPTKVPDFGQTPEQAAALIADRRFLDHLRSGRVVLASPARSYLALPKSLLGWVHRTDRPVPEEDRAFLAAHVARTYTARDRLDGAISREDAASQRGELLLKPCQYGGSHGVSIGRMVDDAQWRAKLDQIWDDPTWVLQEFREPVKTAGGDWVSLGLPNLDGVLGGFYFRTSPSLLVSARDAAFIAGVPHRSG